MPTKVWWEVPIDQTVEGVPESGYAPIFFPPEGAKAVFEFTESQFRQVLSALINGALVTYGDEWLQVVWYFLRNVEYPVSLCDEIAACIAENEGTRQAIRDLVTTDPDINQYITNIAQTAVLTALQRGQNLLKPDACDYGYTFNQASKFVFLLDQLSTDLFQALEVGTNGLERAEKFISAIPVVGGLLPFDEIINLADALVENVFEDYTGAYDQGMYDDLRCGLWCTFKDTCGLSIDEALAYYEDKLGETLPQDPIATISAILNFLLLGDIPGDAPVYAMHLLVIAAMRAGQELFGINFAQLGIRIVAAGDDIDNDWETLCEECVEPPVEDCYDFVGSEADWEPWLHPISGLPAAIHDSAGWKPGYNAGFIAITKEIAGTITSVTIKLAEPLTTAGDVIVQVANQDLSGGTTSTVEDLDEYVFTGLSIGAGLYVNVQSSTAMPSTQRIIEVCIELAE